MKRTCIILTLLFAGLSVASAQNDRSWVASSGSDSNGCGRSAPCRTFAHAVAVTNADGEIDAVDSADYGPVVVDRSVIIDGGHNIATINAYVSGYCGVIYDLSAICVNGQHVTLRNLSINGGAPGIWYGIVAAGGVLHMENVTVTGTDKSGVVVASGTADINDSLIRDCGGQGVDVSSGAVATVDHVVISGTQGFGAVYSGGTAVIRNSSLLHNLGAAAFAAVGTVTVDNTLIAYNTIGAVASTISATVLLSNTTITGNTTGIAALGPVISFVNNRIYGNTTNGVPTLSVYQK
jgi:hypothetical protein